MMRKQEMSELARLNGLAHFIQNKPNPKNHHTKGHITWIEEMIAMKHSKNSVISVEFYLSLLNKACSSKQAEIKILLMQWYYTLEHPGQPGYLWSKTLKRTLVNT